MIQYHPGIYIHVPFCHSKCGYCDFYSITDLTFTDQFIEALVQEIKLTSEQLDSTKTFDTIYLGGGTPSLLSKNQLQKILESLSTHFVLKGDINITLEANPGTLDKQQLSDILNLGVNRISIGCQSFIDDELRLLNRIHTAKENLESFNLARSAGFKDISIDLIFALPGQTLDTWIYSLNKAIEINPEHISVYNLTYEKNTPFYNLKQTGHLKPKNEDDELLFYMTAIDKLQQNGYIQYEISNFALDPSLVSKHNIKYWNHTDYLGFGPSAHSFWQDRRWSNNASIDNYINHLKKGKFPNRFEEIIDKRTKEFEKIFLSLRTKAGLNIVDFNKYFKCSFLNKYKNEVDKLLMLHSVVFAQFANNLKLARGLEKSGQYEEALDIYTKIYTANRSNHQVINGISACLKGLRRYDDLIKFYSELLSANPHQYNYQVELGKAYYLNGNEEAAFENWKQVYINQPDNIMAYKLVALAYIDFRLLDQAVEVYQIIIKKFDNQNTLYRDIATIYRAQLDYANAVTNFLKYYKHFQKQSSYVRSQLIAMSKDDEAVQKIIIAIQNFMNDEFSDNMIQEFLATMYVKNKEYDKAFNIYRILDEHKNNPGSLLTYANLVEKNKVYNYAVLAYELIIKKYSSDRHIYQYQLDLARNRYYLAMEQVKRDKLKEAEDNIRKSITALDKISQVDQIIFQIRSMELKGDIYINYYEDLDQAINLYKQILNKNIHSDFVDNIRIKLGHAFVIKNNLKEAKNYYTAVRGKRYKNLSLYNLAELDYFTGQFSRAENRYQKLLSKLSAQDSLTNNILDRTMLLSQFASDSLALVDFTQAEFLERRLKKSESAEKFLEIFKKQNKLSFRSGINAAKLYMQLNKFIESEGLFLELIQKYPEQEGIDQVYFLLGNLFYQQKMYKKSLENFQEILLRFPSSFYLEEARGKARTLSGLIKDADA
ncbi:MAG: radical SAM family heme chaperone HemW [Calditrichaceae bacterium]